MRTHLYNILIKGEAIIIILAVVIFITSIMVICLICGKGSWIIAGYNTMSKEEKANCDIKKISRAVGIYLLIITVLMGVMAFITQYAMKNDVKNIINYAAGGFGFATLVGAIVLIIVCQKYDRNKK